MSTLIPISEAAEKLALTAQQVRKIYRDGKINAEKIGSVWMLEKVSVDAYFLSNTCGVAEDQPHYHKKPNQLSNNPIALSFFSGAMGLDLGLEKAGFQTILASEIDNASRKTIQTNRPDVALIGDVRSYSPDDIKQITGLGNQEPDLIVGGPPCQAFSTAGRRKGFEDERGNVFLNYINLILELRPKYAVIENVRGLLSAPLKHRPHELRGPDHPPITKEELPGGALNHIIGMLSKSGYAVSFNLYNAANFGTPQTRERVILICSRDGQKAPYLIPTHHKKGLLELPKWRTFEEAVSHLSKTEHHHIEFPDKRKKFYEHLSPGQNWRSLPEELQKEAMGGSYHAAGGKTGFFRRLAWDKPSPTLLTHPAMPATDLCHPTENRPLSVEEYKAVQEFPDHWKISGSIIEQYRQIGNAVPVGLGFAVGKLLQRLLNGENIEHPFPRFQFSRYRNTDDVSWRQQFNNTMNKTRALKLDF